MAKVNIDGEQEKFTLEAGKMGSNTVRAK